MYIVIIILSALLWACEGDPYDGPGEGEECPRVSEPRCWGNTYQVCTVENKWQTRYKCSDFGMTCDIEDVCVDLDGGPDAG